MDREARTCVFLSGRLSPPNIRVVLVTYADVNEAFFGGNGYCQTLAQLKGAQPRPSQWHINSQKLLELTAEMLVSSCGAATAHAVCCAFNVPVYHLLIVVPDHATRYALINRAVARTRLTRKYVKYKLNAYEEFSLYKKSTERNGWWRNTYEIHCLCRFLTADFTRKIVFKHGMATTTTFQPSDIVLYRRIYRLIHQGFGDKYINLLGDAVVEATYIAYALLTRPNSPAAADRFSFSYCLCLRKLPHVREPVVQNKASPAVNLNWFLAGKHAPLDNGGQRTDEVRIETEPRYKTLVFAPLEATMHVNVLVAHVKVLSKERMLHGITGKSLVFTVIKKKTAACSSYKAVEADWCVPTCNSLNFNIQGYDLSLMTALVVIHKFKQICSIDDMEPLVVSHSRYSTHSFQNGIVNTNSYRQRIIRDNDGTCSKVPHFPVVKMVKMGLLHRETVLVNVKSDVQCVAENIHGIINRSAEIDPALTTLVYQLETEVNELVDNQVLGIFKTAYLFGREDAARAISKTLLFDRLLVGLNPKSTKSEFADKSRFDSESRSKSSKKIKVIDKTKDRKGFLTELDTIFPDVFIDPFNSNSRGKWSYADRINHSPDWMFYSPFTLMMLARLREIYPGEMFPSFNEMINKIYEECSKYVVDRK